MLLDRLIVITTKTTDIITSKARTAISTITSPCILSVYHGLFAVSSYKLANVIGVIFVLEHILQVSQEIILWITSSHPLTL